MNKLLIILCLELFVFSCSSIHKSNLNENIMKQTVDNFLINEYEGVYLNKLFETTRKDFDFTNKKVRFIMISGETSKTHYFDMQEKHSTNDKYPYDNGTLYIFNTIQKEESGGYDAAIVYWSKFVIPVEKIVKRLKEKNSN